jgi:cytidylate kinase
MAIVTVSGETGCRTGDVARSIAHQLRFELITETRLDRLIRDEFGDSDIPDKAWSFAASGVIASLATSHHLVVSAPGVENLVTNFPATLRVFLIAGIAHRTRNLMVDLKLDRASATTVLREREKAGKQIRKARFSRVAPTTDAFDLVFNAENFDPEQMALIVDRSVTAKRLLDAGLLSTSAESQIQFQTRLQLARFGISPAGKTSVKGREFGHPSEGLFANLLDFYRIAWEHEPRSFPLQWDKQGKVTEAFTPDFYLPEFDLYIELTTMKQSLVTRKNRKVKRLRAIYPHINIQVFYQKDFQDLVSKYGLADHAASS